MVMAKSTKLKGAATTAACNPFLPPRNRISLGHFVRAATHRYSCCELSGYGITNSIQQNNGSRVRRQDSQPVPGIQLFHFPLHSP